jgi:hypothetical protein
MIARSKWVGSAAPVVMLAVSSSASPVAQLGEVELDHARDAFPDAGHRGLDRALSISAASLATLFRCRRTLFQAAWRNMSAAAGAEDAQLIGVPLAPSRTCRFAALGHLA